MKKFPYLTFFSTWALVFCGTLGAPLCVVTAYDLPYHLGALVLTALIISGFMTLLFTLPELGVYMLIPFGVTVILISVFRWKKLYSGAAVAVRTIQSVLSRSLSFIPDPGTLPAGTENYAYFIGFFVGAVMVAMALLISWGLVSGESMFLPFLVPLPLVALSLIYTDMPPAGWAGVLVCLYYGGVLFTGGLRLHQGGGIGRVTMLALAALLVTIALLVRAFPRDEFEPQTAEERIEQVMRQAASVWEKMNRLMDRDIREREDLSREGELKSTGEHVMDVKTTRTGRLYLRGTSYGRYDGRYWSLAGEYPQGEALFTLGGSLRGDLEQVEVKNASSSLLYTPYALVKSGVVAQVRENYIVADQKISAYSWAWRTVPSSLTPRLGNEAEQAYAAWAKKTYVTLTRSKREALLEYLKPYELPDESDPYALAEAMAAIVRSTVEYDLEPGETPKGQDFVLYFLRQRPHRAPAGQGGARPVRHRLRALRGERGHLGGGHGQKRPRLDRGLRGRLGLGAHRGHRRGRPAPRHARPRIPEPGRARQGHPGAHRHAPGHGRAGREPRGRAPDHAHADPDAYAHAGALVPAGGTATPTPDPDTDPDDEPEGEDGHSFIPWLLLLLLLPALVFLDIKLRQRVCKNRTERMLQGDGKQAVLYGYGELMKLIRRGASESEKARTLADEAAFSDHVLGDAHKRAMAGYVRAARRELEERLPWYKVYYLRYILWLW